MRPIKRTFHFPSAFAAPVVFSIPTGHFRSALISRSVDRSGHPLPFHTYPAIYYLSQLDFSEADVLEFGGGQSTLWWSRRAKTVTCLEEDDIWYRELTKRVNDRVTIHHVTSPEHAARVISGMQFDIIVVDDASGAASRGRIENSKTAMAHVKPGGFIVVDNSDTDYNFPIAHWTFDKGWSRIDFAGFAPGSLMQYCTSFYFNDMPRWFRIPDPPYICYRSRSYESASSQAGTRYRRTLQRKS